MRHIIGDYSFRISLTVLIRQKHCSVHLLLTAYDGKSPNIYFYLFIFELNEIKFLYQTFKTASTPTPPAICFRFFKWVAQITNYE